MNEKTLESIKQTIEEKLDYLIKEIKELKVKINKLEYERTSLAKAYASEIGVLR